MKIFKFGGASVKDADGVRNLERVLKLTGYENVLVVVPSSPVLLMDVQSMPLWTGS